MRNIFIAGLVCLMAVSAYAQVDIPRAPFHADYVSFISDSAGKSALEVYYQVFTSKLLYIHQQNEYMAHYSVGVVIKKSRKQVTAAEKEEYIREISLDRTTGEKDFVINSFLFYLPPGKYELNISLHDLNSDDLIPLKTEISIPDYKLKMPIFSSVEYARKVDSLPADSIAADSLYTKTPRNFAKQNWLVIPSCSRQYGDDATELNFYYEYYRNLPMKDSIKIVYEIYNSKNNVAVSDSTPLFLNDTPAMLGKLPLGHLKPGPYDLKLTAFGRDRKKLAESKSTFSVVWSALALVQNDFETAIDQLKYVAKNDQIEKLQKASKEDRIKLWNEFWKAKDPTPNTDENEVKDEYYRRIAYANQHYAILGKEGWKSDFGMVYIIYGEPDEIERHQVERESRPYEIWYYYNPRRTFIFVDSHGYGEYLLQYPYDGDVTKNRY
jgi:GWxTD domain-containing protein